MWLGACVALVAMTVALTTGFAAPVEFLDASCVTWNSCSQCVNGLGPDIGQSSSVCFAAVGGFGNGTATHCVNDGSHSGSECFYKTTADPGTLSCFGAAVYLCTVTSDPYCTCECSGNADLSGVTISDTKLCD
jgi:hypothetical protein